MTWVDPSLLGIGAALTALVLVGLWSHARRRRLLAEFLGGRTAMKRLSRSDLYRVGVRRALLLTVAGAALAIAAAEPRWIEAPEPEPLVKRVILAIDVSASMQAEDAAPTRLGAAVSVAEQVLDSLDGHEVGLLLFAGTAYPLAPPTLDHDAVRFLLGGVTPRVASAQDPGTLLAVAIEESVALMDRSFTTAAGAIGEPGAMEAASEPASGAAAPGSDGLPVPAGERLIVLIGDGDAGDRGEDVRAAVAAAREAGVGIHTIGVGTSAGAGMVMPSGTYQLGGRIVDANGRPGASRLREPLLQEIAEGAEGRYAHVDVAADVVTLQAALADLGPETEPVASAAAPSWARYDVPFVLGAVALALVVLESLLGMSLPRLRLPAARRASQAREAA